MTPTEADEDIRAAIRAAWPSDYPLIWEDQEDTRPKDGQTPWGRASFNTNSSQLAGFGPVDEGVRIYRNFGTLTVQVFAPRGDGYTVAMGIAETVVDYLQDTETSGGTLFRNVFPRRIGRDKLYSQVNVTAEFEYDSVK